MHPQMKMSKKLAQMEAERATMARELVEYMLDEDEEEPHNPAIDRVPDAVPEQTTDVDKGEAEDNLPQTMDEENHPQILDSASIDNSIDLLADLTDSPDSPTSSSSSFYFLNGHKK